MKKLIASLALVGLCGCSTVTLQTPEGLRVDRKSWIWSNSKVAVVDITTTNGSRVLLRGYEQSSEENIQAIVNSVAAGVIAGMRAQPSAGQ